MSEAETRARIAAILPELLAIRHDIHTHPELGFEEARTAALVAARLRAWGIETAEGVGRTGVVATVRGNRPGQGAIALRADMDALALTETTGLPYASANAGRMHACGHDGHTTMLLGAARLLAERPDFAGTVHFIFQPAEEGRGGAAAMLDDGVFERFPADAVYGMHNMPGIQVGHFATREGPLMAGSGRFTVTFRGEGGHGGNSAHLAADLTVAQAMYILALQTVVSRNAPALEPVVISVGHIAGGTPESLNVMPSELRLGGTMRAFNAPMQAMLEKRIVGLAEATAAAHGADVEAKIWWNAAPLVNEARATQTALAVARAIGGAGAVDGATRPVAGGEDFAFMLERKAGNMIFLGNGEGSSALHTPGYDFNDAALPFGVAYWLGLVREELGVAAPR